MITEKTRGIYNVKNGKNAIPFGEIIWCKSLGCFFENKIEVLTIKKMEEIINEMKKIEKKEKI